jgi:hypothetical protein
MTVKAWQRALYGTAYGNQLGLPYEFSTTPRAILSDTDDDVEMSLIALKHVMKNKKIVSHELFEEYVQWAIEDGSGIGIHTYQVLINQIDDRDSQGNGAMMRFLPFALYLWEECNMSLPDIVKEIEKDAKLTHDNDEVVAFNIGIFSLVVSRLDVTYNGMLTKEFGAVLSMLDVKRHLFMNSLDTAWIYPTMYWINRMTKDDNENVKIAQENCIDADTIFAVKYAMMYAMNKSTEIDSSIYNGQLKFYFTL